MKYSYSFQIEWSAAREELCNLYRDILPSSDNSKLKEMKERQLAKGESLKLLSTLNKNTKHMLEGFAGALNTVLHMNVCSVKIYTVYIT